MKTTRFYQLPPISNSISLNNIKKICSISNPLEHLTHNLQKIIGTENIAYYSSGREALRVLLSMLANKSKRQEVIIPAYTCFSVPAAAVAAGLKVRLVDVNEKAQINVEALKKLPLERASAFVVCNLFGLPENIGQINKLAKETGTVVIDDAAQSLGAYSGEGFVGNRGNYGILSFARGKPLSALGGGAIIWNHGAQQPPLCETASPEKLKALSLAVLYKIASSPYVFPWLSAIPQLKIGKTIFDPNFRQGGIPGFAIALAAAVASDIVDNGMKRTKNVKSLVEKINFSSKFKPILADEKEKAVYPRLAMLAENNQLRDQTIERLKDVGITASGMYPSTLNQIRELTPHLMNKSNCEGAEYVAQYLLTLPISSDERIKHLIVKTINDVC